MASATVPYYAVFGRRQSDFDYIVPSSICRCVCQGREGIVGLLHGKKNPDRQDYIIENLRENVDKQIEAAVA